MTFNNNMLMAGATANASGYSITNSARFVSGNSAYLTRTPGAASNQKTWTFSCWIKLGKAPADYVNIFAAQDTGRAAGFQSGVLLSFINGAPQLVWYDNPVGTDNNCYAPPFMRDHSAWYHCVVALDTTQATAADRVKLWLNGVAQTVTLGGLGAPTLNANYAVNGTGAHYFGYFSATTYTFDGYMANAYLIDGQALTPSSFGQTNTSGVWVPKAYSGTYGTNGFLMEFKNSAALGTDTSGNGNTFTSSGLVAGDQMTDTPTLNFATLNPLNKASSVTLSGGNLVYTTTAQRGAYGTIGVSSGKWYWEWKPGATGSETWVGIGTPNSPTNVALDSGTPSGVIVYGGFNGNLFTTGAGAAYGATFTTGDTVGVALDMDAGTLTFYKNNTTQGTAASSLTGTKVPVVSASNTHSGTINFGQTAFTYTPPTGFVALNTTNLPAPAIKDGSAHFQTALHTGTGSAITINQSGNSTFTPDFVWTKGRSGATDHILSNIISGTGKYLKSNSDAAQVTDAQALTAFGAGSISYGTLAAANTNAATYVDWMWKGGGAGVSNTSGSITSTVSANTTAGFSIVTYTGTGANATVGHGLGVAPKFIIFKRYDIVEDWYAYHGALLATDRLILTTAAKTGSAATFLNSTAPTSSVFSLGTSSAANGAGTIVAYCFAEIPGYSAMGSYTGNGSADGPFIYTGFKPAWVMIKRTDFTADWFVMDTRRATYNPTTGFSLYPDLTNSEGSDMTFDIVSNGFKVRQTNAWLNDSGGTYVFAAFASNPFGGSGAAPATAR